MAKQIVCCFCGGYCYQGQSKLKVKEEEDVKTSEFIKHFISSGYGNSNPRAALPCYTQQTTLPASTQVPIADTPERDCKHFWSDWDCMHFFFACDEPYKWYNCGGKGKNPGWSTQQSFIRGGSALRCKPLPFYILHSTLL